MPNLRYQSAPRKMIGATLARVSTLLTDVGLPNKPTVTGKGGFCRGQAFFPFDDFDDRRIFPGDVIMRRSCDFNVQIKTAAENIFS